MTTICWTVIHHAAAPIVQAATKVAHVAHRRVGFILHRAAQAPHHTGSVAAHPHAWFELVCKVVPVAVAGGGLLIPQPANPPLRSDPPDLIEPAPPMIAGLPQGWHFPSIVAPVYLGPSVRPETPQSTGQNGDH